MMCVQDTFAILGTLLVTEYRLGASYTSDMLCCEKLSLLLSRKPLLSRKAWIWRVLTWPDEFTRLPALSSAGVGLSLPPTHGHGLYLCSCLCPGLNSFFSYHQQGPEAHGRDLVTRWGRALEKLETKFSVPQRFCLSLFWPFFGTKSSLQKRDFQSPPNSENMAF